MFWYLATPYRSFPGTEGQAFAAACKQAAVLSDAGISVFSPIAHTHPVGMFTERLNPDSDDWVQLDLPILRASAGVIVCGLPGWESSAGIKAEVAVASWHQKPIVFMPPGIVPNLPVVVASDPARPVEPVEQQAQQTQSRTIARRDLPGTGSLVSYMQAQMTKGAPEPEPGMGATVLSHTDRNAGTVVAVQSIASGKYNCLVEIQLDHSHRIDSNEMSEAQQYEYTANPEGRRYHFKRVRESGVWVEVEKSLTCSGGRYWKKTTSRFGLILGTRKTYFDFSH